MNALERRLIEAEQRRDAALETFMHDLGLIREDLNEQSVASRVADRVGDATMDMLDEAIDYAGDNRGKVLAGVAAVILWFARGPILDALAGWLDLDSDEDDEPEPGAESDRSPR